MGQLDQITRYRGFKIQPQFTSPPTFGWQHELLHDELMLAAALGDRPDDFWGACRTREECFAAIDNWFLMEAHRGQE